MEDRCCCRLLSITAGAQIFAVSMVLGAAQMFISALPSKASSVTEGELVATIGVCSIELISGVLVFIACNKDYSVLMKPIIAFIAFRIFFVLLALFLSVYGLLDQHSVVPNWYRCMLEKGNPMMVMDYPNTDFDADVLRYTYIFTVYSICDLVLAIWYFSVFKNCKNHLEAVGRTFNRVLM